MVGKETPEKNIDIWLLSVIVLIVLSCGGGLWITGKTIDARLDELATRITSNSSKIQTELFDLRKELQDLSQWARQAAECPSSAAKP